jgi:predicted amidophosphoribosyltransferase
LARILRGHQDYWGVVARYGHYVPWGVHRANGGDRSNYDAHSGRILDLKEKQPGAIKHFKDLIAPELNAGASIVTVPSHDPAKAIGGLALLAGELAAACGCVDASTCLVRVKKISKLAHGGDRSKDIHLQSITVANHHLIRGRDVLLLDDVAKTGNSLEACAELLFKAGASSVECATIGKT